MNASPYTWEQWQERFRRTCTERNYTAGIDMASFHWEWEQGEDPQTVAEAFVNEMLAQ